LLVGGTRSGLDAFAVLFHVVLSNTTSSGQACPAYRWPRRFPPRIRSPSQRRRPPLSSYMHGLPPFRVGALGATVPPRCVPPRHRARTENSHITATTVPQSTDCSRRQRRVQRAPTRSTSRTTSRSSPLTGEQCVNERPLVSGGRFHRRLRQDVAWYHGGATGGQPRGNDRGGGSSNGGREHPRRRRYGSSPGRRLARDRPAGPPPVSLPRSEREPRRPPRVIRPSTPTQGRGRRAPTQTGPQRGCVSNLLHCVAWGIA